MINYIKGELVDVTKNSIIIENAGIGYEILVPLSMLDNISQIGNILKIYTYMHIREDLLQLFGFMKKDELEVFKLLITVSGVGPKAALGILGFMNVDDLKFAVVSDDAKIISQVPGIGSKTARKLIIELKDKLTFKDAIKDAIGNNTAQNISSSDNNNTKQLISDAVEALVSLGYSPAYALKVVKGVKSNSYTTVEELLKLSLRNM